MAFRLVALVLAMAAHPEPVACWLSQVYKDGLPDTVVSKPLAPVVEPVICVLNYHLLLIKSSVVTLGVKNRKALLPNAM
jgi:hypothetical protein